MTEHHDAPKTHEPHAPHQEHIKGPHDPKEINPKMASDIAYWSTSLVLPAISSMKRSAPMEHMSRKSVPRFTPTKSAENPWPRLIQKCGTNARWRDRPGRHRSFRLPG